MFLPRNDYDFYFSANIKSDHCSKLRDRNCREGQIESTCRHAQLIEPLVVEKNSLIVIHTSLVTFVKEGWNQVKAD